MLTFTEGGDFASEGFSCIDFSLSWLGIQIYQITARYVLAKQS